MKPLRSRLADESGVAMLVAIIVMGIVGMLVTAAFTVSLQTSTSSRRDANHIDAMEAAEAGLQVANYRLDMLRPDDAHCVGDTATLPTSGYCTSSSVTLGNGSSYTYYMTPGNTAGTCVGQALVDDTNLSQRCITAIGITNGIQARAQIRVAAFDAVPLFPVAGITSLTDLTNGGNATINGWEATNTTLTDNNGISYSGCELGPGGSVTGHGIPGPCVPLTQPLVLSPVNPGTSNQTIASGNCSAPPAGDPAFQGTFCNDDYRISNGLLSTPVSPYDASSGFTYDAAGRILQITHPNATLTLGGGVYNFCEVDAFNNATISLAANTHTEIFIDSPDDPGSGCSNSCPTCPGGRTGNLNLSNNVTFLNASQDPTALQIYVYGWNNHLNTVNFLNNTVFWGLLYAPNSILNMSNSSNNSAFWGAISGYQVNVSNNFHFNWYSQAGSLQAQSLGTYYRTAWAQCTPVPTTSDPGSSCG